MPAVLRVGKAWLVSEVMRAWPVYKYLADGSSCYVALNHVVVLTASSSASRRVLNIFSGDSTTSLVALFQFLH